MDLYAGKVPAAHEIENREHSDLTKSVALALLLTGKTGSYVAAVTGVSRQTVSRWKNELRMTR